MYVSSVRTEAAVLAAVAAVAAVAAKGDYTKNSDDGSSCMDVERSERGKRDFTEVRRFVNGVQKQHEQLKGNNNNNI